MQPKILAFAGSTRKDSLNKKILKISVDAARHAGALVTWLDLADIPMPLYDGDLEEAKGIPGNSLKFRELLKLHQGFLIATPEYNSSISGVLKNAIDWASRPIPDEANLICFKGKIAALMSASPGALGGIRGLAEARSILSNIGTIVLPTLVAVPFADKELESKKNAIHQQAEELVKLLTKLY